MANPPKKKGTGGETELLRLLEARGLAFVRTPPTTPYDLTNADPNVLELSPLEALATRPDRGEWLVTIRLDDFAELLLRSAEHFAWETHIEVKRYARFALHTIWNSKFGRKA